MSNLCSKESRNGSFDVITSKEYRSLIESGLELMFELPRLKIAQL